MRRSVTATAGLAVATLLLCTACADSPIAPEAAQAQAVGSDRDLLVAILGRLDSIDARVQRNERQTLELRRLLVVDSGLVADPAVQPPIIQPGNGNGGGNSLATQLTDLKSLTDSVFVLAGWMATQMAQPWQGLESCFGFKVKGAAELKSITKAQADAEGGVGVKPWDTGVLANVRLREDLGADFGVGGEFELAALQGCLNYGNIGASPPVRTGPSPAAMALADASGLETALMSVRSQMGLDGPRLEQMLSAGASLFQSGDLTRLTDLAMVLPMPGVFQNPVQTVSARLQHFNPVNLLCGGTNFGPQMAGAVSQGCGFIQSNSLPNLGTYLNMGTAISTINTRVSNLQSRVAGLCSGVNNLLSKLGLSTVTC